MTPSSGKNTFCGFETRTSRPATSIVVCSAIVLTGCRAMASSVAIGVPTEVLVAAAEFEGASRRARWPRRCATGWQPAGSQPECRRRSTSPAATRDPCRRCCDHRGRALGRRPDRNTLSEVATRPPGGRALPRGRRLEPARPVRTRILDLQLVHRGDDPAEIEAAGAEIGAAMQADGSRRLDQSSARRPERRRVCGEAGAVERLEVGGLLSRCRSSRSAMSIVMPARTTIRSTLRSSRFSGKV